MKMVRYYMFIMCACMVGFMHAEVSQTGSSYAKHTADQEGELYEYGFVDEMVVTPQGSATIGGEQNNTAPLIVQQEVAAPQVAPREIATKTSAEQESIEQQQVVPTKASVPDQSALVQSAQDSVMATPKMPVEQSVTVEQVIPVEQISTGRQPIAVDTVVDQLVTVEPTAMQEQTTQSKTQKSVIQTAILAPIVQETAMQQPVVQEGVESVVVESEPIVEQVTVSKEVTAPVSMDIMQEADQVIIKDMEQIK